MKTLDLTDKEISYLILSLKRHEKALLEAEQEDMEDSVTDLLFVQGLQKKLQALKSVA
ncbi:hypothetical protein SRABI118_01055 [Massilia sp. Bi118]|uniref:hypothetical protein n=1 Tax=Massilia sp. Bi118 TaxID=2822346 RepID=UPI001E01F8AC|nr:hypothetical protein [Massilia sp. Bi118]CAH0173554.1 hypothetical protein SRABI118_01055 [Massilia sp. Bi118]